ncbi:MAG TPA: adenylate/guanylate cyclase domain-containing protein, partial [Actinomycetota bacterium]|nr:adenylate/guanylate cyclase domain-containing protein [Actinomycetota bacterium]
MTDLPTGTVTFLFTDIEGSTGLLQTLGDRYPAVLDEHAAIVRRAVADGGGVEVSTHGDAFFAVFRG